MQITLWPLILQTLGPFLHVRSKVTQLLCDFWLCDLWPHAQKRPKVCYLTPYHAHLKNMHGSWDWTFCTCVHTSVAKTVATECEYSVISQAIFSECMWHTQKEGEGKNVYVTIGRFSCSGGMQLLACHGITWKPVMWRRKVRAGPCSDRKSVV